MPETIRKKAARCRAHDRKPEVIIYDDGAVVLICPHNCNKVVAVGAEAALSGWNYYNRGFVRRHPWLVAAAVVTVALCAGVAAI